MQYWQYTLTSYSQHLKTRPTQVQEQKTENPVAPECDGQKIQSTSEEAEKE